MSYAFRSASTTPPGNNNAVPVTSVGAGTTAGDLLFAVLSVANGGSGFTQPTITAPSGWTQLGSTLTNQSSTTGIVFAVFYRWSNGSDPTVAFTLDPSVLFKYALQIYGYSGGPGSGVPTVVFTASPTGTAGNSVSGTATASAQPYAEAFSEKTTTNTSYGTISGLITRSSGMFGSGGGAVDLLFADHLASASGTVGGDTAVPATSGSRGANVLILFPVGGAATVTGTATITAAGVVGRSTGATVAGVGTVTAAGFKHSSTTATVAGTGTVTAAGAVTAGIASPATVAGSATITAAGVVSLTTGATVALVGTVTAAGQVTQPLLLPHGRTLAVSIRFSTIDGGDASATPGDGYDGGDAGSAFTSGIDGNGTALASGSTLTRAIPVASTVTRVVVIQTGKTQAAVVASGRTTATSL